MYTTYRCNLQTTDKMKNWKIKIFIAQTLILSCLFASAYAQDVSDMPEEAADYYEFAKSYTASGDYAKAYDYIKMIEAISTLDIKSLELKSLLMEKLGIKETPSVTRSVFEPKTAKDEDPPAVSSEDLNENTLPQNEPEQPAKKINAFKSPKAQDYAKQAEMAYNRGSFDESLELFLKVKEIENNAIVNNNLGLIYKAKGEYSRAIDAFEQASQIDNAYVQPLLNLALIYKQLNNPEKALFYLEKAIDTAPDEFGAYYLFGNYYYEQKKYDIAASYYYKSVEHKKDFLEGFCGLGASLYALEEYDSAIKALECARTIDENSDRVLYALAKSYMAAQNYKKAKYYLENAMVINPSNTYMQDLAQINYYLGNYDNAIELYQMAISESSQAELYNNLGLCYYHLHDPKKAVDYFEKATKENPQSAIYKYNKAIGYKALGKNNLYNKYKDEALKTKPLTEQDYIDISCICSDVNESKKAIELINQGIEKFPSSKKLYIAKMQYYSANNDTAGYERTKMFYEQKFEN